MSQTRTLDRDRQEQVFAEAIRENLQLVLTFNLPDGWRRLKAVFAGGSPDSKEALIHVMLPEAMHDTELPEAGMTIGGAFRLGHKKCMFSACVRSCGPRDKIVPVRVTWPDQLSQLQRRAFERASPPKDTVIAVRFWPENGEQPSSAEDREIRHGQLEDLSAGGMRIKVSESLNLSMERTYRTSFAPAIGKPALLIDAILRHREAPVQGRSSLGFQFVGLETSAEGLRMLDRLAQLVAQFQRAHQRRTPFHPATGARRESEDRLQAPEPC